jgi:AraC-like DNA-binding protein
MTITRFFLLLSVLGIFFTAKGESKSEQLLAKADSLYGVQQYQQALSCAHEALPLAKGTEIEADVLNLLAVINIRLSDYDEAAKYAKECYALDEKTGDADVMSSSLNTLAAIYMGANQPKEAEKYVLKGIEMAEKANNPSRMAILQAMASEVYHAQGDDQKALPFIEKAYEIDKQSGNEPRAMVRLAQKASVLIGLHNYQDAEKTLKEVVPFLRQTSDRHSLGIALNKLGMALLSQQREQEAVPYYQEAADIFQQMGDPYNEVHSRRGLYETLWKQNPDEAKRQLDRFNDLKDSIYNNVSADKLAKYNAEFGNDWLQIENHEQRQAKWWAIVTAVIAAVLAIAVWLFMRYRHKKQIRINAELSERIKELREKYDILNEQYDNVLASDNKDDGEELNATDNEFLSKTINVINELILTGQIDANHVAERLGLSLFQFRQRLAALTDETPQSFIQTIRMRRACHLLDNHPEMNIAEVAMLCAYNDTPNFTRAFKRTFGMTPTQYLEKQQ